MREKFKREINELIHGVPHDEAIKKDLIGREALVRIGTFITRHGRGENIKRVRIVEIKNDKIFVTSNYSGGKVAKYDYTAIQKVFGKKPITIGIIMYAFDLLAGIDDDTSLNIRGIGDGSAFLSFGDEFIGKWKLVKANGQEADDDCQDDSIIEALYELLL